MNDVRHPGPIIGEVAVLTATGSSATVVARTASTLRHAPDGAALLRSDPEIGTRVATGLARRLDVATTYLADLKDRFGKGSCRCCASEHRCGHEHRSRWDVICSLGAANVPARRLARTIAPWGTSGEFEVTDRRC